MSKVDEVWLKYAPNEEARQQLFNRLWHRQFKLLKNLGVSHPKLMFCMGGIPGSGKTTLAEQVEQRFKGIRLSNHELRLILDDLLPGSQTAEHNIIIGAYEPYMLEQVSSLPNGFLIVDSGIERKYRQFFAWAKAHYYQLVTVDFEVPKQEAEERIKQTRSKPEPFLAEMDRWWAEHEAFQRSVKADFVLKPNDSFEPVLGKIKELLNAQAR
ncbi:AAA family ATPase [Candidatus Microgenomates bacterium]|nr:AAA family ATPase [Candidatus Microgenomates bacterium]